MKKIILLMLISALLSASAITASASRKRNTLAEENAEQNVVTEMTMEEYATQDYVENLPGKKKKSVYDNYQYNGIPINVPDFSRFDDYSAEEINTFSDAVVDYLGWDILLGTSDWVDDENYFYFKPIEGLSSSTNQVFGYGRKKFGEGEIKFKAKVKSNNISSGWLGISLRCSSTQALQWQGNPGYLIVIKPDCIEMQKWFNSCIMLEVSEANIIKNDTWQEYSVVTKKLEQGNQIILTVDGVEYVNIMDTQAPFAPDDGYFMITNSGMGEIQIAPIDEEITLFQNGTTDSANTSETDLPQTNAMSISLKGNKLSTDDEIKEIPEIYFKNGTAMLPVRAVSQSLGGFVSWNNETKSVVITKNGSSLMLTDTYDEYKLNDKFYKASEKTVNHSGVIYTPADVLARFFNMNLSVNGEEVKLNVK